MVNENQERCISGDKWTIFFKKDGGKQLKPNGCNRLIAWELKLTFEFDNVEIMAMFTGIGFHPFFKRMEEEVVSMDNFFTDFLWKEAEKGDSIWKSNRMQSAKIYIICKDDHNCSLPCIHLPFALWLSRSSHQEMESETTVRVVWPSEGSESDIVLSFMMPCKLSTFSWKLSSHHVNKPKLACLVMRDMCLHHPNTPFHPLTLSLKYRQPTPRSRTK